MMYRGIKMMGRKMVGLVIFLAMVSIAMLLVATGPSAEPGERMERAWPVSTMVAQPQELHPLLLAYGRLESRQTDGVRARINATVDSVLRAEGDWVEQGDLLVQLDPLDAELTLAAAWSARAQALAALESAETDYRLATELVAHHEELNAIARSRLQRFIRLHEQRMISDAQLDDMRQEASERAMILARHLSSVEDYPNQIAMRRAALGEADARLRQAEVELAHTQLRAPFSGRIIATDVAMGDRVSTGATLMQIADYGQLQVRVSLPSPVARQLRRELSNGGSAFASAEVGGQQVRFELDRLSGDVKPGQSGVDAFFTTAPDEQLLIGALASLRIQLPAQADVIAMPVHALYEGDRIYVIEDSRLRAVDVNRVGDYVDELGHYRILVRSPEIQRGARLMTTQLPVAMTGLLVSPVAQDDTAPLMLSLR